jgi:hypothetical protein
MIFRRPEMQLNEEDTHALFSSSSLTNHLVRLFSHTVLGLVSLRTLFRCDMSHTCDCRIWQGGRYVLPLQHH